MVFFFFFILWDFIARGFKSVVCVFGFGIKGTGGGKEVGWIFVFVFLFLCYWGWIGFIKDSYQRLSLFFYLAGEERGWERGIEGKEKYKEMISALFRYGF